MLKSCLFSANNFKHEYFSVFQGFLCSKIKKILRRQKMFIFGSQTPPKKGQLGIFRQITTNTGY